MTVPAFSGYDRTMNGNGSERDPNGKDPTQDMGAKLDDGKVDLSLLLDFDNALKSVARVGMHGCNKYKRGSWAHVENGVTRYTSAMMRHLFSERTELEDHDSKLAHAEHVAWNALARLELMLRGIQ